MGEKHKEKLEAARIKAKELIVLQSAYLRAVDELDFELDQLEEKVNEPVVAISLDEIKEMSQSAGKLRIEIDEATSHLQNAEDFAKKIGSKGCIDHVKNETARHKEIGKQLDSREKMLKDVLAKEEGREALKKKFAQEANGLNDNLDTQKGALQAAGTGGDLEKQLDAIRAVKEQVRGLASDLGELEETHDACDQADIVVNPYTPHTIYTLRAYYEETEKSCNNNEAAVNAQIMAKQALEVSPEQLKEMQDVFAFFDANKSGHLDLKELREAVKGAGMDIADSKIDVYADGVTMDEFVALMLAEMKTGDTIEDVLAAFQGIGEGADTITDSQIDSVFQTELECSEYIKEHMNAGDFTGFTNDLFSR